VPRSSRVQLALLSSLAVLALSACAAAPGATSGAETTERPHGYVEGASEMPEAQLHLTGVDRSGSVTLVDLLDSRSTSLGSVTAPSAVTTDGRFVFASSVETGKLSILDTGAWTVDHEDHVHYYSAEPRHVGEVEGEGEPVVHGGPKTVAVWFGSSGTGILLDSEALGTGEIVETARFESAPHDGMVVPFGDGAIATTADTAGLASGVRVVSSDGQDVQAGAAECASIDGSITTNVGVVFGCADGALLVTDDGDGEPVFERIPYPEAVSDADRARDFDNRRGRPSVAAISGGRGAWLLDTRAKTWTFLATETPLAQVIAVDDNDDTTVALSRDGRVLLLDPTTGATLAASEPLAASSLADPTLAPGVGLQLDANRAYLNAPAEGAVYEIDYRDDLRIARTLTVGSDAAFLAETGR
jgi:hypothetical protein